MTLRMAGSNSSVQWLDRVAKLVRPTAIESFTPPPRQVGEDIWVVVRQLRMPPALRLSTNMTLMRLARGALVVHSPVHLDAALLAETHRLGPVEAIIAPNSFHYSYVDQWVKQFPAATYFHAPGLAQRVPGLPRGVELVEQAPALWAEEIDQRLFGPVGPFSEVAFRHRRSQTLVLCDLAFNALQFDSGMQRMAWRLMGVPPDFGPSRTARMTLLRDRAAARPYLRRMAELEFERMIVSHGEVVEADGRSTFRRGFAEYL